MQILNCHCLGFKSVKVLIFSPFFETNYIFILVRYHDRLPGQGGQTQGTCQKVSEVPSPPRKMRMCLLPDTMGRLNMPLFQVDIVQCEAYEKCMPNRPDDNSNIGGAGLG